MNYKSEIFSIVFQEKDYLFCKKNNEFVIFKKKNNDFIENKNLGNIEYISKFISDNDEIYELIIFNHFISEEIAFSFFNILTKLNSDLPKTLDEISAIFLNVWKHVDIRTKRGIFAELYSILNFKLIPKNEKNSIYDMFDKEGNDVEIKSFSKTKREAIISYQQLTNNKNAMFYFIEVFESSRGKTISELYNKLPVYTKKRYQLFECIKFNEEKFLIIKNNIKCIKNIYLSEGLSMPIKSKNAFFIFNIDLL